MRSKSDERLLEALTWDRMPLALVGYVVVILFPFAVTGGLLALLGAATGEPFALVPLLVGLLVLRQINGFVVSLLYHRGMSHGAVRFHPKLEWCMRLWGWLFVGPGCRTWASVHRVHHAVPDLPGDPHSPLLPGESFWTVGRQAFHAFSAAVADETHLQKYVAGLPDDRLEAFIRRDEQRRFGMLGLRFPVLLAGLTGLHLAMGHGLAVAAVGAVLTLPATTGAVLSTSVFLIGGLAHVCGYRRFALRDGSANLLPVDLLAWGEALHQNHHAYPSSCDLGVGRWEWDPGYQLCRVLEAVGLVVELRGLPPRAR